MKRCFWDRVARFYDLAEKTNYTAVEGMIHAVTKRIPDGADVLECAAGTGAISIAAAPKAGHILCTDASLSMLEQARTKGKRLGLSNLDFEQRDLLSLSDPDSRYDVTVAANVLHLLEQPKDAVRELWRVTKPGGALLLPTFLQGEGGWGFSNLIIPAYTLIGFRPKYYFTRRSYQEMIDSCGVGRAEYTLIKGRLPVGLAVLRRTLDV